MGKTTENIEYYLDSKNDKDYLLDLLLNIKVAYTNQEDLTFKIVASKKKGFTVKVGGLFAFVSFQHLGWSYPSIEFWQNGANSIVGSFFTGKIHNIKENPISIQINAKEQNFEKPNLEKSTKYRGVILQKTKYGIFVDLGLHFNWRFGSLLGLVHKSTLTYESDYEKWNNGDEITTFFQGFNENGQLVLGDENLAKEWFTGKMENLTGTHQKVKVIINNHGKKEFYVKDKYKAVLPINTRMYPEYDILKIEKLFNELKNNQTINCKVIDVKYKTRKLILKWSLKIEPKSTAHFKYRLGNLLTDKLKEKLNKL
ncbi:MAG: hypothetical protein PHW92_03700 [Lutibacter sp.]|nr:hypothetical protein [Lutibacter sp.]